MKLLLAFFLLAFNFEGYSQSTTQRSIKNQIEIVPLLRYEWYPEFSYNYAGRASTDYLEMQGLSWGVNGNYKKALTPSFFLKGGIGYYRYSFTKLMNQNHWGNSDSRNVDYPSDIYILYYTDRYGYNTLSANLGLEQLLPLTKKTKATLGVNLNNYFTHSQYFHILSEDINYNEHRKNYFGFSCNISLGMVKQLDNLFIGPTVIVPVYDRWKKDKQFGEDQKESRSKWFRGLGIGLAISKQLEN